MSDSLSQHPDAASRFFDNYLILLDRNKIPEKQRRWYVKHVEDFIRAQNGRKIKCCSGSDVSEYFTMLGRQNRLQDWQFSQCVDAIRFLYCGLLTTSVQLHRPEWHLLTYLQITPSCCTQRFGSLSRRERPPGGRVTPAEFLPRIVAVNRG